MEMISGYELVKKILCRTDNNLEILLECAGNREQEWLEFKAGMRLLAEDKTEATDEDLYWNVTKAVIGMMNRKGGAVVIGIRDTPNLKVVPLETCDPKHLIQNFGLEKYLREQILGKICPVKKKWKTSKGDLYVLQESGNLISDHLEIKTVPYQGHEIALILIKPVTGQCIHVIRNNTEEILFVRKTGVGEVEEIRFANPINEYESTRQTTDEEFTAILQRVNHPQKASGHNPFYNKWKMMIQQLDGMESLLLSNEHDALQAFCGIVEEAIGNLNQFCNGSPDDLKLEEQGIHEVWVQLMQPGGLKNKLKLSSGLQFPDLSEIETLKDMDRQHSPNLKRRLRKLFYDWMNFAAELSESFPAGTEKDFTGALNNLPNFEDIVFVGRQKELDELLQFLSHRENRNFFLTITGEGGMGKSTLALAAAYAVLNQDPKTSGVEKEDLVYENIIWASAKERDFQDQHEYRLAPDIEDHVGLIDTILNVSDPGHSLGDLNAKQNKVRQILQRSRSLLIIDNMETITDDRLFHFLKNKIPAPTKIIGTDRNRAKTDRSIQLPPMSRDESKSLIMSLAKSKTYSFTESDYDRFYELSYGIPKVIEWGCRWLNTHEAEIEDVFRYLTDARKGSRNQIYEYLFGFSYDQLSANAKKILNTLAQFDFPIQCKLIGFLTGLSRGMDEYIDELCSCTLLLVSGSGKERSLFEKYASVQDYIKNYAELKADLDVEFDQYKVYLLAKKVFLEEIIRICGKNGWPHVSAYSWCKNNISMIKWLFQQLIDSGNNIPDIYDFILAVVPVFSNIGLPDEIDHFCRRSLSFILNIPDSDVSEINFHTFIDLLLGSFRKTAGELKTIAADIMEHWAWNMFRQARNNYIEVSAILNALYAAAPEIKSLRVNILVLRTLGLIDKEQNRLDDAEVKLLRVVEMCHQCDDLHIEAITYGALSSNYRDKNDLPTACDYMKKAFTTLEKIEDQGSVKEVLSVFYQKYAKLKIKSGETEDAKFYINKAMEIDNLIGRQYGFAHNKQLMAVIHEQSKNYSQAYHLIREARDIFVRLNSGKEIEADYERIKKKYESQQFT